MLLPASALFLGRPMPPARALVDAGAAVALATDFNPGSAFCESLPLVCSLAATQLHLSPAEALAACTVNAAHVLGRADRLGRIAPGYAADLTLLDAPDWRYLAYHLGGDVVAAVVKDGAVALEPRGILSRMPSKKQRRRQQKLKRHEYEEVYVDEEGASSSPRRPRSSIGAQPRQGRESRAKSAADARRGGRTIEPPSLAAHRRSAASSSSR